MANVSWGRSKLRSWTEARLLVHDWRSWYQMWHMRVVFAKRYPKSLMWPINAFDLDKLKLSDGGRYSYGPLRVQTWNNPTERLEIGRCVSIADDVVFELGGIHPKHCLSTYYLQMNFPVDDIPAIVTSKGPILVQDDVWIARRAIVLSGVTLGQGCIVAAGAVVTHDVAPYSIVAGTPAHLIGMRFSEDIVRELERWADYSSLDETGMKQMRDLLSIKVSMDTLPLMHQLFVDSTSDVDGSSGPKREAESQEDDDGNR